MAHWIQYRNSDSTIEIFDIERAYRYRHVDDHNESFIEVHADGNTHTITKLTDPEAYQTVLKYIAETTGFALY